MDHHRVPRDLRQAPHPMVGGMVAERAESGRCTIKVRPVASLYSSGGGTACYLLPAGDSEPTTVEVSVSSHLISLNKLLPFYALLQADTSPEWSTWEQEDPVWFYFWQ